MDICKLKEKMRNVPFGNSVFQIEKFSRGLETPERTYRNCLLQLNQKIRAMKECEFRRRRIEIDMEEIREKLKMAEGFEAKRLEIDMEEKQFLLDEEVKLIEDCYIEIKAYENILNQLPDFTREQFENAEGVYWEKKLLADMKREVLSLGYVTKDTMQSLEQIGIKVGKNEKGEIAYIKEEHDDNFLCFNPSDINGRNEVVKSQTSPE